MRLAADFQTDIERRSRHMLLVGLRAWNIAALLTSIVAPTLVGFLIGPCTILMSSCTHFVGSPRTDGAELVRDGKAGADFKSLFQDLKSEELSRPQLHASATWFVRRLI